MMDETFQIKTEVFEGPLDLLLSLIEKRKLFISDIALAEVADEYIAYVRNLDEFSVKNTTDFVLIASTLVLIKSKSLLPTLDLTQSEKESVDELEARLKIYQKMRALGDEVLAKRFGTQMLFEKTPRKNKEIIFSPDLNTDIAHIVVAFRDVLTRLPKKEIVPRALVQKVMSLEDMMTNLSERIKENFKMSFREFSHMGKKDRVHVVVSFLAMLELVKQNIINVKQGMRYGDIAMESKTVSIPRYE